MSAWRWNGLLRSRLPTAAEAAPRSDPRYQNPPEEDFLENRKRCRAPAVWVGDHDEVAVVAVPAWVAVGEVATDGVGAGAVVCPAHGCADKSRRAVEYSDCT